MNAEVHIGDCRAVLAELPAESVNCVVTSPPYWGLRDYGLEPVVWGGESGCGHEWGWPTAVPFGNGDGKSFRRDRAAGIKRTGRDWDPTLGKSPVKRDTSPQLGEFCLHCSAWRGCLGLEPTPELYVEHMVQVFREVRRVLRADGTCWLNLGDSYQGSGLSGGKNPAIPGTFSFRGSQAAGRIDAGLKPKDLCMVPARVALALQADGWYLRSEIIWAKPNPMPESVRDRPTKAHEMVYLLAKSERYYYDWEAVAEPSQMRDDVAWRVKYGGYDAKPTSKVRSKKHGDGKPDFITDGPRYWPETRNLRTVWTIPTAPYPEAHFATFPPALVEPCIKAGCPAGGVVLDPFAGSGTVGQVARRFGCSSILIEAQPKYRKLIDRRLAQGVLIG